MTEILDARLGRLRFPTVFDDLKETLGNTLETTGSRATPGDPRAKPLALSLPVRREHEQDGGARLRRQVRALMENSEARSQGLYFALAFDPDLDAWLLVGGADLAYDEGGPSFQRYKLTFEDVFVIGRLRTHRPARRLDVSDRRDPGTPRDFLRRIYSTDFSEVPLLSSLALPVGASRFASSTGRLLTPATRDSEDGDVSLLYGLDTGQAVSFDQDATDFGKADVLIEDVTDPDDPEEVYGPEQGVPTSALQLRNGIVRIRYLASRVAFAVDRWNGSAYVERYRFQVASTPGGKATALDSLRCAEWTPERGVVQVIAENGAARIEAYVTVQRGWREPRIEVYATAKSGESDQEGDIRWAASDEDAAYAVLTTSQGGAAFFSDDPGSSWSGTDLVSFQNAVENWALVYRTDDPDLSQVLAVAVARGSLVGLSDTAMFGGGARDGLRLRGGDTLTGYASVQLEDAGADLILEEAEDDFYDSGFDTAFLDNDPDASGSPTGENYILESQVPATPPEPEDGEQNFATDPNFEYDGIGAAPAMWQAKSHSRIVYVHRDVRASNPQTGRNAFYVEAKNPSGSHRTWRENIVNDATGQIPAEHYDEWTVALKALVTDRERDGIRVGIDWYDSTPTLIGTDLGERLPGTGLKAPMVSAVAPPDTAGFVPFVKNEINDDGGRIKVFMDSVLIYRGTYVDPYTEAPDGFADGDTAGWHWVGTPGRSRSDKTLPLIDPPADTLRRVLTEDLGDYGLWLRGIGAEFNVVARLDGVDVTETFKFTTGEWSWVFMGVIQHDTPGETLSVSAWNVGGLDRFALVPLLSEDIEGPRGRAGLALADSRGLPTLVRR